MFSLINLDETTFRLSKSSLILASWGLLMLLAGIISQWFGLNADFTLLLWAGVTGLGLLTQFSGLVRGMGLNLGFWLVLIGAGWVFTFYVTKYDNGVHADLYGDLAGVWLILLGLGYVATAFQVDRRFLAIAGLHLLSGAIIELSARRLVSLDFVDNYSALLFGLVGGLPVLVAALPIWNKEREGQAQSQPSNSYLANSFSEKKRSN